jgi:hypothetical protein
MVLALVGMTVPIVQALALVGGSLPNCKDIQVSVSVVGQTGRHEVCSLAIDPGLHQVRLGWSAAANGDAVVEIRGADSTLITLECNPWLGGLAPCSTGGGIPYESHYDPVVVGAPVVGGQVYIRFTVAEPATVVFRLGPAGVAATASAMEGVFGITVDTGVTPGCFLIGQCPPPCPTSPPTATPTPTESGTPSPTPSDSGSPMPCP